MMTLRQDGMRFPTQAELGWAPSAYLYRVAKFEYEVTERGGLLSALGALVIFAS